MTSAGNLHAIEIDWNPTYLTRPGDREKNERSRSIPTRGSVTQIRTMEVHDSVLVDER